MRPGDRTIRDELRREAAKVPIPEDMWQNISRQLDQDATRKERRRRWTALGETWRPAVVVAVAAGFFWFALIPSLPTMENMPGNNKQAPIVVPTGKIEPSSQPVRSPAREVSEPAPAAKTSPTPDALTGHLPNMPQ